MLLWSPDLSSSLPFHRLRVWCSERLYGLHRVIWVCLISLWLFHRIASSVWQSSDSPVQSINQLPRPSTPLPPQAEQNLFLRSPDLPWSLALAVSLKTPASLPYNMFPSLLPNITDGNCPSGIHSRCFLSWSPLHLISRLVPIVWKTGFWHNIWAVILTGRLESSGVWAIIWEQAEQGSI